MSPSPATRPQAQRSTTPRWSASRSTRGSCGSSPLIPNLTLTLVLLAGVLAVGSGGLTLGGLVAFVAYVLMLTFPLEILAWIMALAGEAESAAVRIYEVFDTVPTIQDRPGAAVLGDDVRGDIRFEGVSFTYEGSDRTVLSDIDLTVAAGEIVAVVGATGSGKTTLVTLLTRLYDPTVGRITLDGHDLRDLTVTSLRRHVGFAFEEPSLFSASVRENLLMGKPDATEAEVLAALEVAQADFALDLPWGLDTRIGEQGLSLSGGQRQRLALARADHRTAARPGARRPPLRGRRPHRGGRPGRPAAAARGVHRVHRRAPPVDGGAGAALDPPRRGPPRRRRHPPRPARLRAPLPRRALRGRRGGEQSTHDLGRTRRGPRHRPQRRPRPDGRRARRRVARRQRRGRRGGHRRAGRPAPVSRSRALLSDLMRPHHRAARAVVAVDRHRRRRAPRHALARPARHRRRHPPAPRRRERRPPPAADGRDPRGRHRRASAP